MEEKKEAEEQFHIVNYRTYFYVWASLVVLLALSVTVAILDLTKVNVLINILIASFMALLDLLFFMNLRHEGTFLKRVVFLAVLALTLIIAFTFSDIGIRYR